MSSCPGKIKANGGPPLRFGFFDEPLPAPEPTQPACEVGLQASEPEFPLRFGSFADGEMPPLVGDTVKLPSPRRSEVVSIHFRSISGGSVTVQKSLHEVTLASLKEEIENCDGIPQPQQRLTHRGKNLQEEGDLRGLFDGQATKEIEVSVTMRVIGGMLEETSSENGCSLKWDLHEPIVAGATLPPAVCYKVSEPTEQVEGSYTYCPPLDTPLVAGNGQRFSVKFAPLNRNYECVELVLTIDVLPARPIPEWVPPSDLEGRMKLPDIKYVLDNMRVNAGSQLNRADIEAYYQQFRHTFVKTMCDHSVGTEEHIDAIVFDIKHTAAKFGVGQIQNHHHAVIPDVLAKIFAVWSLMSAIELDANEIDTEFHKKPHPVQIVAIFQMLGMSGSLEYYQKAGISSQNVTANHLVQIGAGEGNSVVLAMTSILLALFGYEVNCASYSALLSDRDFDTFLNVFRMLGVDQYIVYGTLYTLCQDVINENGNVRDLLKNTILPTERYVERRNPSRPRILMIDEVDVFFKEDFYGECYTPLADIGVDELPQIEPLTDWIWANKGDTNMTLATVKAATVDVDGVQVEIYKALEAALVGYEDLLEEVVKSMICHVQSFTKYKWVVEGGKIWYVVHNSYRSDITFGYRTMFAYYHEFEQSNLPLENLRKAKKILLRCGSFSFAEIPKYPNFEFILGVTGTLEFLSSYETNILEKEYNIKRQTYMPSAYGIRADKLDYAPNEKQDIMLTEPEDHFSVICNQIETFVGSEVGARRAVLVFFESEEKLRLFEKESALNVYRQKYTLNAIVEELDTLEKTKLIREASSAGRVTLLTKAFGRGVDFFCRDQEVIDNKGVVVLQTFLSDNLSEESHIKGRTARQGQYGAYRMILDKSSLEVYHVSAADLRCPFVHLGALLNAKRHEHHEFKYAHTRSEVERAKVLHKRFLAFIDDLLHRRKDAVQTFLITENKAEVMLSQGEGGTLILLDATGSMSNCMRSVKAKVREIFSFAFQVLERHGIPTGSITLQFGAYRNYNSTPELLFQCSEWENNANDLCRFLESIEVSGGWGHEAMEVGLHHAAREAEAQRLAQVIVIGDAAANTTAEVAARRSREGENHWLRNGFPHPTDAETQLARLRACNVPVFPFYLTRSAQADYERYAALTGGTAAFLDMNSPRGAELLMDSITERVLYSIGGENGAALVTSYREIVSTARAMVH